MKILRFQSFAICLDGDLFRLPEDLPGLSPWTDDPPPRFDASLHLRVDAVQAREGAPAAAWLTDLAQRGGWPAPVLNVAHPHHKLHWGDLAEAEWRPGRGWVMLKISDSIPPSLWPCIVAPMLVLALGSAGLQLSGEQCPPSLQWKDSITPWPFGLPLENT